jgi:PAS domain S-box-containing protein
MRNELMYENSTITAPIRALLVEDNPGDVLLLRQMLRRFQKPSIELVSTERLETACRHLTTEHYDIVLLDLSLPDSQGFATFERLHQHVSLTPIVVLTGLDDEELALRAVRAGAQDYLVKGEIGDQLLMRAMRYAIERKRTETTLRESQVRYRALFENDNTSVFLITLDGHYLNVNQQAATMLAMPVEEAIGQPAHHFFAHGQPINFEAQSQQLLAGATIPIYECDVVRADGTAIPLEVNVTLVRDAFEKPLYIQSIARDIARRRAVEAALEAERTQLAQRVAERTTELSIANSELMRNAQLKDEFLATVSHELRTPLSVILTLSEALQDAIYGTVNEPQLKALQRIRKSGRHLLALINDILDVSKIESGKLELELGPTSVQAICEDSFQMVQEAANAKQLTLTLDLDPTVTIITVDGRRLMQVLLNLLNNAIKFTPEGGVVELKVSGDVGRETVTFLVRDNGIGIAAADLPRLFQPFVQLDSRLSRRYQGAGLGLALVYRLVKLHGGSVSVISEPEQGSSFFVALPWRKILPQTSGEIEAYDHSANGASQSIEEQQGGLILVVEDHLIALEAIETYLRALNYGVITARTGIEALALVRERQPDLILMDIQMPEMDGLEAIQTIRQQEGMTDTPIIALTALAMPGDRERCLAAGATSYISKPLSLRYLHRTINMLFTQQMNRGKAATITRR